MVSIYNFLKVKLCYRTYWKQWLTLLAICLLVFACSGGDGGSDDPNNPCPNQPQLTTLEVSNIIYDENTDLVSATFTGEIQNIQLGANCETFSITNQGFVYGSNIQPTTSDNVINVNGQNPSVNISELPPETTYYVRAYLTNTLGTFYGNEVNFTTPQSTNPIYLAENGVTIRARDWANIGDSGIINGVEFTIVSKSVLIYRLNEGISVSDVCTTKISDMSYLFDGINSFNEDISSWDVSNVTDMSYMFKDSGFNQVISDYWDFSNVNTMEGMFLYNTSFNQPLNNWDVSNVINMGAMFNGASSFNQPLNNWDVSNVTNMYGMFQDAYIFNQPLDNWNVSNVTEMTNMFYSIADSSLEADSLFNQDLSSWDVSSVTACHSFCPISIESNNNWTLPKPNFSNCGNTNCD